MTTQLNNIKQSLPLRHPTGPEWAATVMADLNAFLADHASCERKANAAALMLVSRYPEYPELQDKMIGLAREELDHFHQVFRLLRERNITLAQDEPDHYVKSLLKHVRHAREEHILDRMMVVAMVEARSCERFCLLAEALPEGALKTFYTEFAVAEGAHYPLFVNTAISLFGKQTVEKRLHEWLDIEAKIAAEIPYRAAVH